ncbi:MAG TPA: UDP-glucose 4-epimerase GalE [Phycisphaerales bacterium]|nr:UDP-glucose 4-epimerase GalE [Phycisphaerales bacterium]
MDVLVTGAAGYIGSHAVLALLRQGRRVLALDNLSRGHRAAVRALEGEAARRGGELVFAEGDVGDAELVRGLLARHRVPAVMHFAALAYVGESVEQPLRYYRNNTASALTLLEACAAAGVSRFIFSSTCATYGEPGPGWIPIPETCPQSPINPYGWSKLHTERMLFDLAARARAEGRDFGVAALRYFNVAGCDRAGLLGEHHHPETHLIPVVLQAALGVRRNFGGAENAVTVFGDDYPTPDGTCVRDYVHVEDLVGAHLRVLEVLGAGEVRTYNLGIGTGYSVRQIIEACRRVTGRDFEVRRGPRRPGDPPMLYADPSKIGRELGWSASITDLDQIVESAWTWLAANPTGYTGLPG